MPGDRLGIAAKTAERPIARTLRVGHGFQRREGFRGNNEQRFGRIKVACRLNEIGAVDVGHEAERYCAVAENLEPLIPHPRPWAAPADADIDGVADKFSAVAFPLTA